MTTTILCRILLLLYIGYKFSKEIVEYNKKVEYTYGENILEYIIILFIMNGAGITELLYTFN